MKRFYSILLVSFVLLISLALLSSCGGGCEHTFDDGEVVKEPSCVEYGYKFLQCTSCGFGKLEEIDYGGHSEIEIPAVTGTCSRPGKTSGSKCVLCDEVVKAPESAEKLPHTFSGDVCVVCGANATSDGLEFVLNKDGNSYSLLSIGTCTSKKIVVPSTFEGKPVTAIVDEAFKGASSVKSITIPNSVSSMGKGIFAECTSLEKVTVPFIGNVPGAIQASESTLFGYFFGTEASTNTYGIKQYFSESESAVYYIPTKLENVVVTDGELLYGTFLGFKSLKSISVGGDNYSVPAYCFSGCSLLEELYISDKFTTIGKYAFQQCANLEAIPKSNSVVEIADYAFAGCSALKSYTIPSSVTELFEGTFLKCTSLTEITIPSTLSKVGPFAFQGCSKLESLTIENGVTLIDEYSFSKCTALKSVTIPGTVEKIKNQAFFGCSSLTDFTIENGVKELGINLFSDCSALQTVSIPETVSTFGTGMFTGCSSLYDISISPSNPVYTSINGDIYSKDLKTLILYAPGNEESLFTVPSNVEIIGKEAFLGASKLEKVVIGTNVKSIEDGAFKKSGLISVDIPGSIKKISAFAFSYCDKLEVLTMADSVTSICERAFYGCTSLKTISIGNGVNTIEKYAFQGCANVQIIYIPKSVNIIGEGAFYQCNENGVIRCEILEYNVPSTWDKKWNYSKLTVEWGE
ncbi:MAG: leucine-rich repeat domain-containing protein [Clostridia bacterium]|nr:leucine-rich repeat domain-containing protein [Clostridia bacterium]